MRQGVFEIYDVFTGAANHAAKQGIIDGYAKSFGAQDVVVIESAEDRRASAIGAPMVILILTDGELGLPGDSLGLLNLAPAHHNILPLDIDRLRWRPPIKSGAVDSAIGNLWKHGLQCLECFLVGAESLRTPMVFPLELHDQPPGLHRWCGIGEWQFGYAADELSVMLILKQLMYCDHAITLSTG